MYLHKIEMKIKKPISDSQYSVLLISQVLTAAAVKSLKLTPDVGQENE